MVSSPVTYVCPVCEKEIAREPDLIERWKEFRILRCPHCDVFFSHPIVRAGDFVGDPYVELMWHHRQFLENPPVRQGRLLDVGCGSGYIMSLAKKIGFDVYGVDINTRGIDIARDQFGLSHAYSGTLAQFVETIATPSDLHFNVITLFECLEHLDRPAPTIRLVRDLLPRGGSMVLSVPNRERLFESNPGDTDYPPNHQTRWSASVLKRFVETQGFEVQSLKIKTIDVDELSRRTLEDRGLKIASFIQQTAAAKKNSTLMAMARFLMSVKSAAVKTLYHPAALALRMFRAQGFGLYCVAKKI